MRKPGREPLIGHKYKCSEQRKVMEASTSMRLRNNAHSFRSLGFAGFALLTISLLAVSGCSSGSSVSNIKVGAVTFADASGTKLTTAPASLTTGQGTYVDVTVTNDSQLLGADWSVYCGSALPPGSPLPTGQTEDESCGTFTPTHTTSCIESSTTSCMPSYVTSGTGYVAFYTAPAATPKNGTVTLYAAATSDQSKFSSVTLTIGGLPISVGFAPAPPTTMQTNGSASFRVVLNNDNTDAGVKWTVLCGSTDCGSFDPTQTTSGVTTTYTAPATVPTGNTVQVTATSIADPTKSASAKITIN
jgi:hypothetical protein